MPEFTPTTFDTPDLHARLDSLSDAALDALDFGVIGFDVDEVVRRYNSTESRLAGLAPDRVLGHGLFTVVAPCMNNFLVAQRFQDAMVSDETLDTVIDYVFTLRMRPSKVALRLIASKSSRHRYVVVRRQPA